MSPFAFRQPRLCSISANNTPLIRTWALQYRNPLPLRLVRLNHDVAFTGSGAAIVVGAGPAGIATVGNLLETIKDDRIIWIDSEFNGGRINRAYREVPGNTAVKLFVDYAKAVKPFKDIYDAAAKPNAITVLESLPQDGTCSLSYAGDMLNFLTERLVKHPRVTTVNAQVQKAVRNSDTSIWAVTTTSSPSEAEKPCIAHAPLLVYCTGSHPTELPGPETPTPERLPLDVALTPSLLSKAIESRSRSKKASSPVKVGVVGGSHSAVLVLMNLFAIAQETNAVRVHWLTRYETLKYAEQRDGYILNDNTGLKGQAAQFAKEALDGEKLNSGPAAGFIDRSVLKRTKLIDEFLALEAGLADCDFFVQAVGYEKNELPVTLAGKREIAAEGKDVQFNPRTGAIGKKGDGLYGAGIAFPEEVDTPEGKKEMAVGMWKFMTYLKRAVPQWVKETGAGQR